MKIGFVTSPVETFKPEKDTTLALMLEAQARGYEIYTMDTTDLWFEKGLPWAAMRKIAINEEVEPWFTVETLLIQPLTECKIILMRKDPPVDMDYYTATYLLEQAEKQGVCVLNKPASLRDANEKLFALWFPQCCPPHLITAKRELILKFVTEQGDSVIKPLNSMGGQSIFRLRENDDNLLSIIDSLTDHGKHLMMVQKFIPDIISGGDKRVLMIHGQPIPYALARIPAKGDFRGNLSAGGQGKGAELTARDRWICDQVAPVLKEKKLWFVGLDIIGDYLTEINVTSPTCARELNRLYDINIAAQFFDGLSSFVE